MRVKHASQVLSRSLDGRPTWQQVGLGALRMVATALRATTTSPVWPWLGGLLRGGAARLEQWVHRL